MPSSCLPADLTPLPRAFYARPTEVVAPDLLGQILVRRAAAGPPRLGRIVEVEAYLGERDLASHARRGPTPRASIMFGPPGHLYVYLIYGMYHCMNFVTERDGEAGAVLIRAAEPLDDPEQARVWSGPGKLCRGLEITLADRGLDLTDSMATLVVAAGSPPRKIARSARIGVDYAGAWGRRALRFFDPASRSVSGPRRRSSLR